MFCVRSVNSQPDDIVPSGLDAACTVKERRDGVREVTTESGHARKSKYVCLSQGKQERQRDRQTEREGRRDNRRRRERSTDTHLWMHARTYTYKCTRRDAHTDAHMHLRTFGGHAASAAVWAKREDDVRIHGHHAIVLRQLGLFRSRHKTRERQGRERERKTETEQAPIQRIHVLTRKLKLVSLCFALFTRTRATRTP